METNKQKLYESAGEFSENTFKQYQIDADNGDAIAMHNLAICYGHKGDYKMMKKYYLMAIDKGVTSSMNNLSGYYRRLKGFIEQTAPDKKELIDRLYDKMMKYYHMAISLNDPIAMYNIAVYYQEQIENCDCHPMCEKCNRYEKLLYTYYFMAIDHGNVSSLGNLVYYYRCRRPFDVYNLLGYFTTLKLTDEQSDAVNDMIMDEMNNEICKIV